MIRSEIIEYVEEQILPLYTAFDRAHNIDHAQTVIEESATLAANYEVNHEMVYIIAAFHDLGLCEGRERHHIVSAEILLADKFIANIFDVSQRQTMSEAIEDHRASAAREPRSIYGRIVAEADRIISTKVTLRRTVQYGLKQNPTATPDEHFERFDSHLQAKYAEGGYLKLYISESGNAERLRELRAVINNKKELRDRFDQILKSELMSL
ncbi:MAG: HD domain-containing protein [Rikenellaceae bacterium]